MLTTLSNTGKLIAILVLVVWGQHLASARIDVDTVVIRQLIDSGMTIRLTKPVEAMMIGKEALALSGKGYYFGVLNSLQIIGESHYQLGLIDSALYYYSKALEISTDEEDNIEIANNYISLATIFLDKGQLDSSAYCYKIGVDMFYEIGDSASMCDAILRYGNVFSSMGKHDEALEKFLLASRLCEAIGNTKYVAYSYGGMGIIHDKQRNYEKAEEYFLKALELFTTQEDIFGQMTVSNNLGILYKNKGEFKKSLASYERCQLLADSINHFKGKLSAHTNLGILSEKMGNFENARDHARIGLQLAIDLKARETYGDNLNTIARSELGLGAYEQALDYALEAIEVSEEVGALEKQRDANLTMSDVLGSMHRYDESLKYYKAYTTIRDSLYNVEKAQQISELQTIYETEKKDKEIELMAKNAELDNLRKTRLWIAFALSLLAGGFFIYAQRSRRIRDRKILSQEKELEVVKREAAELERDKATRMLDFKKQELAAKALQLARKNEFLQSLNSKVEDMRDKTRDGVAADSARQISRQIRMDIESDEDWEQFLSSFREVHRDFVEDLQRTYPDISKGETRLACLMKMNLSPKEIAAMLNVTPDGIKKARYRLRKKLNLDSDVDIQQFLIGF